MWLLLVACASLALAEQCSRGAVYNEATDKCYAFSTTPLPFKQAERACVAQGGELAKIENIYDNSYISALASFKMNSPDFWLGGSFHHGEWMWIDWSALVYTKWAAGPSNSADSCLAMQTYGGKWLAESCEAAKPYVCVSPAAVQPAPSDSCTTIAPSTQAPTRKPSTQAPVTELSTQAPTRKPSTQAPTLEPSTEATTTEPPTEAPTAEPSTEAPKSQCAEGWEYFAQTDSCYWTALDDDHNLNFGDSEKVCEAYGAHVASIHSDSEFDFVNKLTGNVFKWTSIVWDNEWKNIDGTPVDYKWDTTVEPFDEDHLCVRQNMGRTDIRWTGAICTSDYNYFVCKKPAHA